MFNVRCKENRFVENKEVERGGVTVSGKIRTEHSLIYQRKSLRGRQNHR